ncbi:Acetyl esterase/lipase [Actinomyces denticolens]|uniref:Acetyl esterase/lipase n=1 Tax=Actinomyces denticolens TaxID=52767 RepID=A0ABY1IKB2_9ACTO|nr:alpha/beta hydrolase [Actinomyces denticolens]SHJ28867.1 Acetyl esterase/lipase [Actinomyces denticolens]
MPTARAIPRRTIPERPHPNEGPSARSRRRGRDDRAIGRRRRRDVLTLVGACAVCLLAIGAIAAIPVLSYSLLLGAWGLDAAAALALLTAVAGWRALLRRREPGARMRLVTAGLLCLSLAITGWMGAAQIRFAHAQGTSISVLGLTGIGQWGRAPDDAPVVLADGASRQTLRAGIWYPRGEAPEEGGVREAPIVILLHGGGWRTGDRDNPMTRIQADWLADQGYLAIALEYPLSLTDLPTWELAQSRLVCSLAWVGAHAGEYGGDPGRLAVVGDSAGGHLALETAYRQALGGLDPSGPDAPTDANGEALPACQGSVPTIRAVATTYPITDPAVFHDNPDPIMSGPVAGRARLYAGGSPAQYPERYESIDPTRKAAVVGEAAPPVLIVHGEEDHVVPVSGTRGFDAVLEAAGAHHETIIVPYADHVFDLNGGSVASQIWRAKTLELLRGAGMGI